jgi:prophage maintenance system killer protein
MESDHPIDPCWEMISDKNRRYIGSSFVHSNINKRTALAASLVFLESQRPTAGGEELPTDDWEELVVDVASRKIDCDATTQRLRKLVKAVRKR